MITRSNNEYIEIFDDFVNEIQYFNKHGVIIYFFQMPLEQNIMNFSEFEKKRLKDWEFNFGAISEEDCRIIKKLYPEDTTIEYIQQVYDGIKVYEKNSVKYLSDFRSKYVNVVLGKRITYNQPATYRNNIYIYGQCTARGNGVEDKYTIASFLQNEINEHYSNTFRVVNMAVGCGSDLYDDIVHIRETEIKEGDIIILCTNLEMIPLSLFVKYELLYFDTSKLFSRPHEYGDWFTDSTFHTLPKGNERIAHYIFEKLEKNIRVKVNKKKNEIMTVPKLYNNKSINKDIDKTVEFSKYLTELKNFKHKGKNGCIVMNCNPFTNGHRYLIEYAAQNVDHLYIFVVEEERSLFPYVDRIKLVKKGISDLNNVTILSSGKYIISAITFPGYFLKDGNTEIQIDCTMDVYLFGKYISPVLDISVRFVGDEPLDYVTRKYNEEMKKILPQYGIELRIIKRKEIRGLVISASAVRKLLSENNFEKIKELVPITTFDYLKENYRIDQ